MSASAEHHRLTNSSVISSVDLRQLARSAEKSLPFAGLLLLVFVSQHALQILVLALVTFGLHRANVAMRSEVAKKAERETRALLAVVASALLQLVVVFNFLWRDQIPAVLALSGRLPATGVLWLLLYLHCKATASKGRCPLAALLTPAHSMPLPLVCHGDFHSPHSRQLHPAAGLHRQGVKRGPA